MVLIPKKQKSGPCRVNEFRGISLVAVSYKALCSIMQKRTSYGSVCRTVGLVVKFPPFCRRPTDPRPVRSKLAR